MQQTPPPIFGGTPTAQQRFGFAGSTPGGIGGTGRASTTDLYNRLKRKFAGPGALSSLTPGVLQALTQLPGDDRRTGAGPLPPRESAFPSQGPAQFRLGIRPGSEVARYPGRPPGKRVILGGIPTEQPQGPIIGQRRPWNPPLPQYENPYHDIPHFEDYNRSPEGYFEGTRPWWKKIVAGEDGYPTRERVQEISDAQTRLGGGSVFSPRNRNASQGAEVGSGDYLSQLMNQLRKRRAMAGQ